MSHGLSFPSANTYVATALSAQLRNNSSARLLTTRRNRLVFLHFSISPMFDPDDADGAAHRTPDRSGQRGVKVTPVFCSMEELAAGWGAGQGRGKKNGFNLEFATPLRGYVDSTWT